MKYARSRKKWSDVEKSLLFIALDDPAIQPRDVSIPGRKPSSVERMARKYGLITPSAEPLWSGRERALIRRLHKQGLNAKAMFESGEFNNPPRSLVAIEKKRYKLRIVRSRRRSRAAKCRRVWQNGEFEQFEDFLEQNSDCLAIGEIAMEFGVSNCTVQVHQARLGVNLPWEQAKRLPYNVEKKRKGIEKLRRKLLRYHRKNEAQRKQSLLILAEKSRRRYPNRPKKVCPDCQTLFPKSRHFFYFHDYRGIGATSRRYDPYCKACTSIRRRKKRKEDRDRAVKKARGTKKY